MSIVDRQRRLWQEAASGYDAAMAPLERLWLGGFRDRLIRLADGRTIEVGIGTGANLDRYPASVDLVGVDASSRMLAVAQERARRLSRTVEFRLGDAEALDVPDASADTVVATLLLCSVSSVEGALAEFARVLRPDGRLLLLDHVESSVGLVRLGQAMADRITANTGERWRRRPADYLPDAGFTVDWIRSSRARLLEAVSARRGPDAPGSG